MITEWFFIVLIGTYVISFGLVIYFYIKLVQANELIKLIANACTYSKEHSVKEILRKEIKDIDTVTYESTDTRRDYIILSEFFEEYYKEHWDNE